MQQFHHLPTVSHIKGHQDDESAYEDLNWKSQQNIDTDQLTGSSPLAYSSAYCFTYALLQSILHRDIACALQPEGSAELEVSSPQATTYVSTTSGLGRNQTHAFGSPKLSFGLLPWLTI
eukprot:12607876-Ditylum_brightwellii.AAC.1